MPKVTADIQTLFSLIGKPMSIEKLKELCWLAKAELNDNPQTGEVTLELSDTNRPDLWSVEGISRLVQQFISAKPKEYSYLSDPPHQGNIIIAEENVSSIRPYIGMFLCRIDPVTDRLLKDMIQTQEKLAENFGKKRKTVSIGIYPASEINFPVIYRAVKPCDVSFIPLDFEEKMTLEEILSVHPKGKEYSWILEKRKSVPLMIDNKGEILSFPPIINSRKTGEVKIGDTYLAVEATGTDLSAVQLVLSIFAMNLSDRGGKITRMKTLYPDNQEFIFPTDEVEELSTYIPGVNKLLGSEFGIEKISSCLRKMGFKYKKGTFDNELIVSVPFYRRDIMHEVDLIEDIAIASDYNDFQPLMPESYTHGGLSQVQEKSDVIRQVSIGLGFLEYMGNILTSFDLMKNCAGDNSDPVEISNPMTSLFSCLRDLLFPGLLCMESKNSKSLYPHLVFEAGETVKKASLSTETLTSVAYMIAGPETTFSELHSVLQTLCDMLSVELTLVERDYCFFISGRSAEIFLKGAPAGFIGEIHPVILDKLGIRMPTVICEIFDLNLFFN
ncbi:phenylalanine--tRNA ligase subunit beta [candidate division WOR-3 bacterium]|nr:phenylalanine--tRNA ligase subunit beta [candidate division WOR-3 bacterium]